MGFPNLPRMVWLARSRSLGPRGPLASPRSLSPPPRRLKSLGGNMRCRAKRAKFARLCRTSVFASLRRDTSAWQGGRSAEWNAGAGRWPRGLYKSYDNSTNITSGFGQAIYRMRPQEFTKVTIMDLLAPARSALAGLWLRPHSFRRFPSGSSLEISTRK